MPRLARLIVVLVAAALLLWPAAWNGWPLIFSDTPDYLWVWTQPAWFRPIRPPAYGWLIGPLHQGRTLWPVVAAQALLTAWLMWLVARRVGLGPFASLAIVGVLALLSGAPWLASWVMADALSAPMVLAAVLVALGGLSRLEACGVWLALVAAASVHLTHLPALAALFGALLLLRLAWRGAPVRLAGLGALLAALVLAPALNLAANRLAHGEARLAFGSSVFLAARLVGDGLMQRWLAAHCPLPAVTLCEDRHTLVADSDHFLWNPASPVWRDRNFFRLEAELAAINPRVIAAHWSEFVANGLARAARQLVTARVGTDLSVRVNEDRALLARLVIPRFAEALGPAAGEALDRARQTNEEIARAWPAVLAGPLSLAAVPLLALVFAVSPAARRSPVAVLALAALAAAVGNAVAVGLGGAVHDRYAARLMWLFPFALALLVGRALSRRAPPLPGADPPRPPGRGR
ncbi:MAG: hypothetical protein RML45_05975 [Acetobacteraceae bacterium]|nr:hypothetical protein [Acetobacteraceae bacterium]